MTLRRTLVAILLLAFAPFSARSEVSFRVETETDKPDKTPGDGRCEDADGFCTLRAAVEEANALGSGVGIALPSGEYVIDSALSIRAPLTLQGRQPGMTVIAPSDKFADERLVRFERSGEAWSLVRDLSLDGRGRVAVVETQPASNVRLERVVIRNGRSAQAGGAGIAARGPIVLESVSVVDNRIEDGGARGAAMFVEEAPAFVTQSTFTGNRGRNGGGIFARNAEISLSYVSLVGNDGVPVGGYQQNPQSRLVIEGSWLGQSTAVEGKRAVDCRSTARNPDALQSRGDNLVAVTGPTTERLDAGVWVQAYDFACEFHGENDRVGSQSAPLNGSWKRVTDTTGLVGVEAAETHPVHRMVPHERCPSHDAFGRLIPQGQACDAGAIQSGAEPVAAPVAPPSTPAADSQPDGPDSQRSKWIGLAAVFVVVALGAGVILRRRRRVD